MNKNKNVNLIAAAVLLGAVMSLSPDATADGPSRYDRATAEKYGWIYDDFDAGVKQAKATGRPMMVVLRCPP